MIFCEVSIFFCLYYDLFVCTVAWHYIRIFECLFRFFRWLVENLFVWWVVWELCVDCSWNFLDDVGRVTGFFVNVLYCKMGMYHNIHNIKTSSLPKQKYLKPKKRKRIYTILGNIFLLETKNHGWKKKKSCLM